MLIVTIRFHINNHVCIYSIKAKQGALKLCNKKRKMPERNNNKHNLIMPIGKQTQPHHVHSKTTIKYDKSFIQIVMCINQSILHV